MSGWAQRNYTEQNVHSINKSSVHAETEATCEETLKKNAMAKIEKFGGK